MWALFEGRRLPEGRSYLEVYYERLLSSLEEEWRRIADFLGIKADDPAGEWLLTNARRDNWGKWRRELSEEELVGLEPHIRLTLEFLGYSWGDRYLPCSALHTP